MTDTAPAATRGRNAHPDERVHTWADASGTWHGKIIFPGAGVEADKLPDIRTRVRNKVRRAIREEVMARGEATESWKLRVEEVGRTLGDDGALIREITWRETFTD